jgi:hypothetical protein
MIIRIKAKTASCPEDDPTGWKAPPNVDGQDDEVWSRDDRCLT